MLSKWLQLDTFCEKWLQVVAPAKRVFAGDGRQIPALRWWRKNRREDTIKRVEALCN